MSVTVTDGPAALARAAALEFKRRAGECIEQRSSFAVALAGGGTPKALYRLLATPEFSGAIDWRHVHFFWGDERCVPPDDANSNFAMAKKALLDPIGAVGYRVHRMHGELEPRQGAAEYARDLKLFFGAGAICFDLIYLGLGADGHTASLFPGSSALEVRDAACVAVNVPDNAAAAWRLTLTYPVLNAARAVVFLAQGSEKADILARVLQGPRDPASLPAQGVAPADGELLWLVDRAAASRL